MSSAEQKTAALSRQRSRNARGAGIALRAEIIDAARGLLVETGSDASVTLRAVARRVGIAAPSIYAHFDSPEQIVQAVVAETFTMLRSHLEQARQHARTSAERLMANCRAYVAFGAEHRTLYTMLFSRLRPSSTSVAPGSDSDEQAFAEVMAEVSEGRADERTGLQVFALLLEDVADAIADGSSGADNALITGLELWTAMHGLVMLRAAAPHALWPGPDRLETDLICRLAVMVPPAAGSTTSS